MLSASTLELAKSLTDNVNPSSWLPIDDLAIANLPPACDSTNWEKDVNVIGNATWPYLEYPHCLVANTNDVVCKISGSISIHVYLYNCIVGFIRFKLGCSVVCIPRSNFSEYVVEFNGPCRRSRIIIRCYRQAYPLSKTKSKSMLL